MVVEFRMLGPLEAMVDGTTVSLGGAGQRAVLAILLADAGAVVGVERVIDGIWDQAPPATAANVVQGYVSALRKGLGRDAIVTHGRGYSVRVGDGALDLDRFQRGFEAASAERAAGRAARAAAQLRDALGLWRGSALSDLVHLPGIQAIAHRLDELRLTAVEQRIDADLALARHDDLISELQRLVAEHPYRERLHAQLMLALYRCGRQAEALAAYRATHGMLVETLGIEPGSEL